MLKISTAIIPSARAAIPLSTVPREDPNSARKGKREMTVKQEREAKKRKKAQRATTVMMHDAMKSLPSPKV